MDDLRVPPWLSKPPYTELLYVDDAKVKSRTLECGWVSFQVTTNENGRAQGYTPIFPICEGMEINGIHREVPQLLPIDPNLSEVCRKVVPIPSHDFFETTNSYCWSYMISHNIYIHIILYIVIYMCNYVYIIYDMSYMICHIWFIIIYKYICIITYIYIYYM